jgi:hypothetical protein
VERHTFFVNNANLTGLGNAVRGNFNFMAIQVLNSLSVTDQGLYNIVSACNASGGSKLVFFSLLRACRAKKDPEVGCAMQKLTSSKVIVVL